MRLLTWMPRELLKDLRAIDPVLDHAPPTAPDPESIMRRMDDAGLSVDSSPSPGGLPTGPIVRSRRWLAPVCASAVVVAVAVGVLAYTGRGRPEGGSAVGPSSTSVTQPAAITDPSVLTSTSWELARIVDPSGTVPSAASARVVFTFNNGYLTDHVGDAATAHITPGRMEIGTWTNDLMTQRGPNLDMAQANFVGKISDSTLTWSITGDTLTIALGGGGSLVFARHAFDAATQVFGSVSGRFMARGGPVGGPSPHPIHGIGTVQLTNTDTGQTQTVDTTTGGSYATSIVPGTYTVKGDISTYQSGHSACVAAKPVVVHKDRTTKADVYCQER